MSNNAVRQEDLDWVKLRKDMDKSIIVETVSEKAIRKFTANPSIPVGCLCTVAALTYGIYNFGRGRSMMSQYMMRARVVAQGFTVVAVLVSLGATLPKQK